MSRVDQPRGGLGPALGLIEPSTSIAISAEAPAVMLPAAVPVVGRLPLPGGEVNAAALEAMLDGDQLERTCATLVDAGVMAIAFACTTGSLLHGPGFDRELAARITASTGLPATTTATGWLDALEAVGAKKVGLGTPYIADLNRREVEFLAGAGYEVVAEKGLGIDRDRAIAEIDADTVAELTAAVAVPKADTIFLSCTNMPTIPLLGELERRHGRPVLSSNAVTLWALLRLAGVEIEGRAEYGSLLAGTAGSFQAPPVG